MTFSPLMVSHFIESVPTCQETDSLERLLTLVQSTQASQWVITTQQQHPIGVISTHDLLLYVLAKNDEGLGKSLSFPSFSMQETLIKQLTDLIHPLVVLSFETPVKSLLPQLLSPNPPIYAIVNPQEQFLGLFNLNAALKSFIKVSDSDASAFATDFDQFPLPILGKTSLGDIIYRNQAWSEALGDYVPVETDFDHPISLDAPQTLQSSINHTYLAAQLSSWQYQEKAKGNSYSNPDNLFLSPHQWQFFAYPYENGSTEPTITLIVAIDVTKQKQHYRALEAKNADLLQLNRLKDEFFACISHELKSPLTAVVGLSSLLRDKRVGDLSSAQERYAELIYSSGRQLMALVNDLLDLTRLETGQLQLNPTNVNIQEVCEKAYQTLQNNYANQLLPNFSLEISQAEKVWADEQRLGQMLVYLLDNAVKFTENDGNIGLKVTSCPKWVTFTIWDTGEGIPEADQSSLFQRFQPPGHHLSSNYPVTGLGLVLTQRLARAHRGDLSFLSKVGQGSYFTLLLPTKPFPYSSASFCEENQRLVLIVETLSHLIEDLSQKLSQLGYQSVIARTGTEALEKARQLQPTLIFLNPWLPLLSGWDVLTLLKSDSQTQAIPVILTDYQTDSSLKSYQADGVLKPPIEIDQLKEWLPAEEQKEVGETSSEKLANTPLTLLLLYPESELPPSTGATQEDLALVNQLWKYDYRILQADDLEQAAMLVSIWKVDVLVIKGDRLEDPNSYWQGLSEFPELTEIPLVTLDQATTEAVNDFENLTVFPYLGSSKQNPKIPLWQVVHEAAASQSLRSNS